MEQLTAIIGTAAAFLVIGVPVARWAIGRIEAAHEERWRSVGEGVGRLDKKMDRLFELHERVSERVAGVEGDMKVVNHRLNVLEDRDA